MEQAIRRPHVKLEDNFGAMKWAEIRSLWAEKGVIETATSPRLGGDFPLIPSESQFRQAVKDSEQKDLPSIWS